MVRMEKVISGTILVLVEPDNLKLEKVISGTILVLVEKKVIPGTIRVLGTMLIQEIKVRIMVMIQKIDIKRMKEKKNLNNFLYS